MDSQDRHRIEDLSTPSLGITRSVGMTLIPSTCLSTPSLGITYYCYTCSKSFPARLFQLPLSGSPRFQYEVEYRRTRLGFQLPLSGSLGEGHRTSIASMEWTFNSLSRDHLAGGEKVKVKAKERVAFNSLSRDHTDNAPIGVREDQN